MADNRYIRHIKLKEIGNSQAKLNNKTAAIIGLGGIGCMSAELLARAGVGNLILVDKDRVELVNLHRQILYDEKDIGRSKVKAAVNKLRKINSDIKIKGLEININDENIRNINDTDKTKPDLILDCVDNLKTRLVISDFCRKTKTPWIFATALGTKGMVHSILPGKRKKDAEWFEETFGNKKGFRDAESAGILNTVCNAIACIQATEAIKILLGKKASSELIRFDIWKSELEKIKN